MLYNACKLMRLALQYEGRKPIDIEEEFDLMKTLDYRTSGTCSQLIHIELNDDNVIENIQYFGGCQGNLTGIASLVTGMKAEDVIARTEGITCGFKPTSCPDQLAKALKQML